MIYTRLLDTSNGSFYGSFRHEQMMEVRGSEYHNTPQTVVEALSFLLGHYDWQPGREAGIILV